MHFQLTEEQSAFAEVVRRLAMAETVGGVPCNAHIQRSIPGRSRPGWRPSGFIGITIPEVDGGCGR